MKRHVAESKQTNDSQCQHGLTFAKVLDGRKQPIRGLWVRNGRYYARLAFEDGSTGETKVRRVPLLGQDKKPVCTIAKAVAEMNRLKVRRSEDDLPVLSRTPRFGDYVESYLDFIKVGEGTKKPRTIAKEESHLRGWVKHMGGVHLDKIRKFHINAYIAERLKGGVSPRTVNLDVVILRNVLNRAIDDEWLKRLPTENMRPLKCVTLKRALFTSEDLEKLCTAAMDENEDGSSVTKNWLQFCDYVRLLAYCGAREQEALALRWQDVDFERGQLIIGASGDTKNQTGRTVDFNPNLKAHLESMFQRRAPDSQWLFPSPQRGDNDIHAQTFRESLKLVRRHAGMEDKAFHDLRHHFISYCVMSGIDYMTIAEWVGHRDGGVLIGRVYGHLADAHKKEQAKRVNFGPRVVSKEEAA
jgi:integrase